MLQVPPNVVAVWLDPAKTSPNALVAISGAGVHTVMRPGDVVAASSKGSSFKVWNPVRDFGLSPGSLGGVGFLALKGLTLADLQAVQCSRGSLDPVGPAAVLFAGVTAAAGAVTIQTYNLHGLRVTALPMDPTASGVTGAPADYALTITPGITVYGASSLALSGAPQAIPMGGMEDTANPAMYLSGSQSDRALSFSLTQLTVDVEVTTPGIMRLTGNAITGTGINTNWYVLIVEGR
jgi:hypothetical protein